MARHTLFAYADGSDLAEVADEIERGLVEVIEQTQWRFGRPRFVDQRGFEDDTLRPGETEVWELGLNFDLPDPPLEPVGWFRDVEQIAIGFGRLHKLTGRDFVIGIFDNERGISDDLFIVNSDRPDLGLLRRIIGVADASS
jgi:hypothetical protein